MCLNNFIYCIPKICQVFLNFFNAWVLQDRNGCNKNVLFHRILLIEKSDATTWVDRVFAKSQCLPNTCLCMYWHAHRTSGDIRIDIKKKRMSFMQRNVGETDRIAR
jgi:hypothetical protein